MSSEELKFKATLIFWKLYETNLRYNQERLLKSFRNSKYVNDIYDEYYFENFKGKQIPLKWIATTGHFFLPLCLKLCVTKFRCIKDSKVYGKIQIDAHFFPEGVLVLQAKLDFAEYYTIDQFIIASIPSNIVLADNISMDIKLDQYASDLISFLKTKIKEQKKLLGEKASPWHHNWILWKSKPETSISEFNVDGKHFRYALGICTRSDKWRHLNTENYITVIEDICNLSPYQNNCIYITHPGNCIIPSDEFMDPNSIKNTLVDVIFAAELGNVQRYLILNHLQDLNFKSLKIQRILYEYKEEKLNLKELIARLEDIEQEFNELVLEINNDLQVTRTPRLIFTSVFKTKIFRQMIHVLHGFDFYDGLTKVIMEIKDSLARERNVLNIKVNEEENIFLRNLQVVFIIGLVAQMITLFYAVEGINIEWGFMFVILSIIVSMIILVILKRIR